MRWSHAALNCGDLDTTEKFYTTWFGARRVNEFDLGDLRIVFLRLGDAYLELFGQARPPAGRPPAVTAIRSPARSGTSPSRLTTSTASCAASRGRPRSPWALSISPPTSTAGAACGCATPTA